MRGIQAKAGVAGSVERRIALQLLFCHSLIFTATLLAGSPALPILGVCLLSLSLMLNIPYNLHLLEIALDRLTRGLPVEPVPLRLRWPFTRLVELVNVLGQQSEQQTQMKQSTLVYRDQLLQQVGKAAAQEERNRLARDLHDSIKQQIFSIAVSAAAIKARWERDLNSVRKIVDDIERIAQEAQVEMQALLQQLRPIALENVGLIESLRMQCQALSYRTGAEVLIELNELPADELLPLGAPEMIFRIVQEGFANIARHARASRVWLSLWQQRDALLIEIGDDGQGFDLAQAHGLPETHGGIGLSNVRERVRGLGGMLSVWSLPGKGTTLHLCIPLIKPLAESQERLASRSFAEALRRVSRILRGSVLAAEAAAVCVLLFTPVTIALWAVGVCTLFALICWLWIQQYRLQLAVEFGRSDPQHLLLSAESYGLLSGILLLCILWPAYLLDSPSYLSEILHNMWLAGSLLGALLIALILAAVRCVQDTHRYDKTLAYQELRDLLLKQRGQIAIDWLALIIGVALTRFLLQVFPDILQDPVVYAMGLILLVAWLIAMLARSVHIVHRQNALRQMTNLQNPKGGNA